MREVSEARVKYEVSNETRISNSYNKRIVESIIFKIVITAHFMIKVKHKKTLRIGFIIEWEVVIFIMILLLFHHVNLKYKLV